MEPRFEIRFVSNRTGSKRFAQIRRVGQGDAMWVPFYMSRAKHLLSKGDAVEVS